MKLYATTTSERASKGQGGNEHILTVITAEIDGERQEIASMSVVCTDTGYRFNVATPDGRAQSMMIRKGNKQKGEDIMEGWSSKDHEDFDNAAAK